MTYKTAVVDDHPMICDAIEYQVQRHQDFVFQGRYETIAAAASLFTGPPLDVLVCDLHLSDGIAIPLIRRLSSETATRVVVYTANDHPLIRSACESAGAIATFSKSKFGVDFIRSVRDALQRAQSPCESGIGTIDNDTSKFASGSDADGQCLQTLTERELDVLLLMGEGHSTMKIASSLFISGKTVESHRSAIKRKLNTQTKDQLISLAARWSVMVSSCA